MELLVSVLIGAVVGWIFATFRKLKSAGVLLNIILGISGGFVANWLVMILGMAETISWLGIILTSGIGAIVVLVAGIVLFSKKK